MIKGSPSLLYGIQNTDLTDFVYKLHVLGGDYLRDAAHNLNILTNHECPVYAALVSEQHIRLDDASLIYRKGMDMNQRLFTSEFRNERAFLLKVEARREGHAYGDVLLMDCATLRRDVELRAPSPIGIAATDKDGTEKSISFAAWADMELGQKEALQSWRYQYFFNAEKETLRQFCIDVFNHWKDRAQYMTAADLLSRIRPHTA